MSESVFGVQDQLLVCCSILWVIMVPRQHTQQFCSQVIHLTCTLSRTSTRPDAFRCHPHSTTLPPPSLSCIRGSCLARSEVTHVLWSFWSYTAGQNGARTWILQTFSGVSNPTGEEFKGMSVDSQTWLYSYIMKGKEREKKNWLFYTVIVWPE